MDNLQIIALIVLLLALYTYLVIPIVATYATQNYFAVFLTITFLYTVVVSVAILDYDVLQHVKTIVALYLLLIAFGLMTPPIMISASNVDGNPIGATGPLATLSSDIFIYKLMPDFIPHEIRYAIVYIIAPAILLMGAMMLTKKSAEKVLKMGV